MLVLHWLTFQNVSEQLALKVKSKCTLRDRLRVVPHFSSGIVENLITSHEKRRHVGVSPFLASGDFHARSRFARSTIPEEKWGTTRSLPARRLFWLTWLLALGQV